MLTHQFYSNCLSNLPDNFAVPKCVVKRNDAPLPHQKKTELVVAVVASLYGKYRFTTIFTKKGGCQNYLISINEGKIKLFSCRNEGTESFRSGSDLQSDLVADPGLTPKLFGDVSEVLIDVTCNNHAIYKIKIKTSKIDQYRIDLLEEPRQRRGYSLQ